MEVYHRDEQLVYHGEVETVDATQGMLWILHGALKERKPIDASGMFPFSCTIPEP